MNNLIALILIEDSILFIASNNFIFPFFTYTVVFNKAIAFFLFMPMIIK